jgi:tight adherence protein B
VIRLVQIVNDIRLLKVAGIGLGGAGLAYAAYASVAKNNSWLNRGLAAYSHYLERRFASLFMPANPKAVIIAQAVAMYAMIATGISLRSPEIIPFAMLIAALPLGYLELKHRRRVLAIEQQTDAFVLALANALKATPSVADAFISLVVIVPEPLKSEIDLATKQMRLGCTLEDALLLMANRIGSRVFDTALASILIGQRVGGNLPKILETSAGALRELNRLESMVRSKTASGRIQMWVISIAPAAFVIFFDRTQPHYFDPLTESRTGIIMLAVAIVLWVVAIIVGRKILRIDV